MEFHRWKMEKRQPVLPKAFQGLHRKGRQHGMLQVQPRTLGLICRPELDELLLLWQVVCLFSRGVGGGGWGVGGGGCGGGNRFFTNYC